MLILVVLHCFIDVLVSYQPLEYQDIGAQSLDIIPPWPLNEPRWVIVNDPRRPNRRHPNCLLQRRNNWMGSKNIGEDHPLMIGNWQTEAERRQRLRQAKEGNVMDGGMFLYPRYYIKKRQTIDHRIQILATLQPEPIVISPDRFRTQLMALICHNGIIESIRPNSRIWGSRREQQQLDPGTCGIEEQLVKVCLIDRGIPSFTDIDDLVDQRMYGGYPRPSQFVEETVGQLAMTCQRLFKIMLPTSIRDPNNEPRRYNRDDDIIVLTYLCAAKQASFDRILMLGLGLGYQCPANTLGWGSFVLSDFRRRDMRRQYLEIITNPRLDQSWFFCKLWDWMG